MEFTTKSNNGYYTLKLILKEGDYSITDNNSPVSYELQLISGSKANFTQFRIGTKIVIDSTIVNEVKRADAKQYTLGLNSKITLASGQTPIKHDNNGSKTITFSYSIDMAAYSYTAGAVSGSGSMKLSDIPRKATTTKVTTSFTDLENPTVTFNNPANFNLVPYINFYKKDESLAHSITRAKGKYSSPYTFTLTDDERTALTNACNAQTEYAAWMGVVTYNGDTNLGYSSLETKLKIVNANPIFDSSKISFKDTDNTTLSITGNEKTIVQNKSVLSVTSGSASGAKGATISKYDFEINGVSKTLNGANGGTVTIGNITKDGTLTLAVTVTDSRGNTTKAEVPVLVIPYQKPILTRHTNFGQIICERCDEEGVIDKSGQYLKLIIQGKWYSLLNNENTADIELQITTRDYESAWIQVPAEIIGGGASKYYQSWCNINTVVEGVNFALDKAYVVTVRCIDRFGDDTDASTYTDIAYKIPTSEVALHLGKGGNMVAIGTYADEPYVFKIDEKWAIKYKEKYITVDENGNLVASTVKN